MAANFRDDLSVSRHSFYTELIFRYLQIQCGAIASVSIWTLSGVTVQAGQPDESWNSPSELTVREHKELPVSPLQHEGFKKANSFVEEKNSEAFSSESRTLKHEVSLPLPNPRSFKLTEEYSQLRTQDSKLPNNESESIPIPYRLEPTPVLIAAPENFNPSLRLPPPIPPIPPTPPQNSNPSTTSSEKVKPIAVLENIETDYRYDTDNYGQNNLFIEPTAQFRLSNGNKIFFKTGFNSFEQRSVESVTNVPLQVGWQGKIGQVTLQTAAGVDLFNRLPTAINLNTKVETPILQPKVSSSGRLLSVMTLSANLEQGPYKSNARTLENQITAWRFGPDLYWQIDRDTSLFSSLRLGNYNDGNSEVQTFSRLERKFGQFSVAANLFTWSYDRDLERTSGYFSPSDFLVYNAEVAWEGNISDSLRCRLAANFGRQRLKGEFDNASTYQTRCTVKVSPNVEVDIGYSFSNVRNQDTGGSSYDGNSLTGQLRLKF